ncbi:MAG: hypothetical protein QMD16_13665 [Desulfitobacteriaceae bacterium]|nr:hypothetical protein [Desulfitobacteriaceae bacterium]
MRRVYTHIEGITPVAIALYAFLLHWVYVNVVVPNFYYMGYHYVERKAYEFVVAYLFVLLPVTFIPAMIDRPSRVVVSFLFLFVYVPSVLISMLAVNRPLGELVVLYISLLSGLLILTVGARMPCLRIGSPKISIQTWWLLISVIGALTFGFLLSQFGLRVPPSPLDPYQVRLEARSLGALTVYTLRLGGNVIGPVIMSYGILTLQWWLFLLGSVFQLLIYSFDGTKLTLLAPAILLGLRLLLGKNGGLVRLSVLLSMLVMMAITLDRVLGLTLFSSFFVRRAILTPGLLTGLYFDFFSEHQPFFWSHSFLRWFVENPYGTSPPFLIGTWHFGSNVTSANASIWADGIANLGLVGPIIMSILAAIFLWFVDGISKGKEAFGILSTVMAASAFVNSALFTSFLTHGFIASSIFVWLLPGRPDRLIEPFRYHYQSLNGCSLRSQSSYLSKGM